MNLCVFPLVGLTRGGLVFFSYDSIMAYKMQLIEPTTKTLYQFVLCPKGFTYQGDQTSSLGILLATDGVTSWQIKLRK